MERVKFAFMLFELHGPRGLICSRVQIPRTVRNSTAEEAVPSGRLQCPVCEAWGRCTFTCSHHLRNLRRTMGDALNTTCIYHWTVSLSRARSALMAGCKFPSEIIRLCKRGTGVLWYTIPVNPGENFKGEAVVCANIKTCQQLSVSGTQAKLLPSVSWLTLEVCRSTYTQAHSPAGWADSGTCECTGRLVPSEEPAQMGAYQSLHSLFHLLHINGRADSGLNVIFFKLKINWCCYFGRRPSVKYIQEGKEKKWDEEEKSKDWFTVRLEMEGTSTRTMVRKSKGEE